MRYFRVEWSSQSDADPMIIFTEVDADRWEQRKIEIYKNGSQGFADLQEECNGSMLGEEAWPDFALLHKEPEFSVLEITKQEFEKMWENRKSAKCDE